ncbi:g4484 [Coccomyxa viridis]|uniref:G4484 protein n=1 Tax=Coccomyxa viridis TaxID=1274662 RepID=A0ABP1FQF7_9CHLO
MSVPPSDTESVKAPEPRVKRAPNYRLLWPLALAPLFPAITIAFRKQPVIRTRLLFGTAAAVLVGAHHSGMTVGINSK